MARVTTSGTKHDKVVKKHERETPTPQEATAALNKPTAYACCLSLPTYVRKTAVAARFGSNSVILREYWLQDNFKRQRKNTRVKLPHQNRQQQRKKRVHPPQTTNKGQAS